MSDQIIFKIYMRIRDYAKIIELSTDTPKISNLAYEEMIISFIELVHKFEGLNFLIQKIKIEQDEFFKMKVAILLLPYEKDVALDLLKDLKNSSNIYINNNVNGLFLQKYSTIDEITIGIKHQIENIKIKRKIK